MLIPSAERGAGRLVPHMGCPLLWSHEQLCMLSRKSVVSLIPIVRAVQCPCNTIIIHGSGQYSVTSYNNRSLCYPSYIRSGETETLICMCLPEVSQPDNSTWSGSHVHGDPLPPCFLHSGLQCHLPCKLKDSGAEDGIFLETGKLSQGWCE